jgi:hypothetical protein
VRGDEKNHTQQHCYSNDSENTRTGGGSAEKNGPFCLHENIDRTVQRNSPLVVSWVAAGDVDANNNRGGCQQTLTSQMWVRTYFCPNSCAGTKSSSPVDSLSTVQPTSRLRQTSRYPIFFSSVNLPSEQLQQTLCEFEHVRAQL